MVEKNYYEILDIDTNSTSFEIKSAYRKLARIYHPDVNKNKDAVDMFKQITLAYETLSDDKKRHDYDIVSGIFKKDTTNVQVQTQTKKQQEDNQTIKKTYNKKDVSKQNQKVKTKEKFSYLKAFKYWLLKFKQYRKVKQILKPQKGENITTEVTITPDEVITGSKRIINIRTTKTCPQCNGHRFTNGNKCSKCDGKGCISETKRITVTIPKGIKNGAKLRIKEEGASGKNGGPNGDVFIIVKIETKTQIHYNKLNIYYNIPITPYEAALGEEISIPAFDGTIKLKLPKNTTSGQKFRLAGQGIKNHEKTGDLIVTVTIEISHDLSDDEIKLYEQLKNISHQDLRKNFGYGS